MFRISLLFFPLFLISNIIAAQVTDSIPVSNDTLIVLQDTSRHAGVKTVHSTKDTAVLKVKKENWAGKFFKSDYPSPKKAVIFSLILPGSGQFYNKKYWKIPIVYAGFYVGYRLIAFNQENYNFYRDAYYNRVNGLPDQINNVNINTSSIKRVRDAYRKQLQQSYLFTVAWYLLTGIDAFVDAHLASFDVGDDLTFHINPVFDYDFARQTSTIGLGFSAQISRW